MVKNLGGLEFGHQKRHWEIPHVRTRLANLCKRVALPITKLGPAAVQRLIPYQ